MSGHVEDLIRGDRGERYTPDGQFRLREIHSRGILDPHDMTDIGMRWILEGITSQAQRYLDDRRLTRRRFRRLTEALNALEHARADQPMTAARPIVLRCAPRTTQSQT